MALDHQRASKPHRRCPTTIRSTFNSRATRAIWSIVLPVAKWPDRCHTACFELAYALARNLSSGLFFNQGRFRSHGLETTDPVGVPEHREQVGFRLKVLH